MSLRDERTRLWKARHEAYCAAVGTRARKVAMSPQNIMNPGKIFHLPQSSLAAVR